MKADVPAIERDLSGKYRQAALRERIGSAAEFVIIPALALLVALVMFGIFVALFGKNPLDLYFYMYQGAFGTWFSGRTRSPARRRSFSPRCARRYPRSLAW